MFIYKINHRYLSKVVILHQIALFLLVGLPSLLAAQNYKTYFSLSSEASEQLKKGNFDVCIAMYKKVFKKWDALPDECV